jgi:hypothetical protein
VNPKKGISILLILVLLIQVLPLQQITAWFFKNQIGEELAHNINPVKVKSGINEVHPPFSSNEFSSRFQLKINWSPADPLRNEDLFTRHADDILTPPPNC